MNSPKIRNKLFRRVLILVSSLIVCAPLWAQNNEDEEEIYELSPFEIDASNDIGYYAENTLAGSRLRTNLADLAASISVITMEQMEDTASVDINDVFRYEANTEGADTYTEGVNANRNDGLLDTNAGGMQGLQPHGHATANRIRGIGRPGTTINYYQALSIIPFDSYNTGRVEISRGPNSLLFGLGNPAGIVNQSTAQAIIDSDSARVSARFDDRSSFRASVRFNKSLIEGKLAMMGAILKDDRAFVRKPSYDNTERAYAAITVKPFEKTIFRASVEDYSNDHRRPNTISPEDSVSEWRSGGRWTYNPVTGFLTSMDSGEVKGPLSMNNRGPRIDETRAYIESLPGFDADLWNGNKRQYNGVNIFGSGAVLGPGSILYAPGLALGGHTGTRGNARPIFRIVDGQVYDYTYWRGMGQGNYRLGFGTPTNPAGNAPRVISGANNLPLSAIYEIPTSWSAYDTSWSNSHFHSKENAGVANYIYPGVTDKSIYDWEKINTLQMNFGEKRNITTNLELEQEILPDLNLSLGYFEQDYDGFTSYTISQLNTATIYVDTMTHRPDGRVNELFGLPFMMSSTAPDQFHYETINETARAMLAWTPDFTDNDGWLKWLGRHQAIGLASNYSTLDSRWRKRWYITDSDEGINKVNIFMRNPNVPGYSLLNRSVRRNYYLASPGDPQDGTVTQSSGEWNHSTYEGQMQYFNYDDNAWKTQRYRTGYIDHPAHTRRAQREVDSLSFGLTSYLWDERLITTVGWREDDYRARETTSGPIVDQDDNVIEPGLSNAEQWVDGYYDTERVFDRWNRWDELSGETSTMGAVLRPFDNRDGIQSEFLSSLGFSYNRSDNFNPPGAAQVDHFGQALGKPEGNGEDYGIQFSLMDNRLFARINWFKASNENERANSGVTPSRVWNLIDQIQFRNWARRIALINFGFDPTSETFSADINELTAAQEDQIEADTAAIYGLPYSYHDDLPGSVAYTQTAEAKGMEIQIMYNPTNNWTIKFTGGKQETVFANAFKEYDEWIAVRGAYWDNARAANFLKPEYQQFATHTTFAGREVNITDFWNSYGYTSQITGEDPRRPNQQAYWDEVIVPQVTLGKDIEGQVSKGQRKYRASLLTNYQFQEGRLKGFSVGGSMRWEDKAIAGYYGNPLPGSISGDLALSDVARPIYDSGNTRIDLWGAYSWRLNSGQRVKVQLNIVDAFENGRLQTVAFNLNGDPYGYRILDPRQFILTTTVDF